MSKVVLITGSSSGIGRASVKYFLARGWRVVATMRTPERETEFNNNEQLLLTRLDVTDPQSIDAALQATMQRFGRLDAIVNNAGYGLVGVFEGIEAERIQKQFETNVFGLMAVTRAAIPLLRTQGFGTIINVASMGGRITFPLYSVYHATKFAVEGFSESLSYELDPFNIKVKVIEPGAIRTDFYDRSADKAAVATLPAYRPYHEAAMAKMDEAGAKGSSAELVAATIWKAANDSSFRLRYPVGSDAKALIGVKRWVSDTLFRRIVQLSLGLNKVKASA
jgi:NAD(P)-dependent dehydrogenase (short-subunit alcohol dehydrogenase family)